MSDLSPTIFEKPPVGERSRRAVAQAMGMINGYIATAGHTSANGVPHASSAVVNGAHAWRAVCDELLAWWHRPELAEVDDGVPTPSRELIEKVLQYVSVARDENRAPPTRFAPCIDGGVAFEWDEAGLTVRSAFVNTMRVEVDVYQGDRLLKSDEGPIAW